MRLARFPIALLATLAILSGQTDWPSYGHDPGGAKYSPLRQITPANVANLHRSWTYHTGDSARQFETTPIVAGGRMYLSTQNCRIVALAPETGAVLWTYDPHVRRPREHRGVSYWPGADGAAPRIIFTTADARLIALDAATGKPVDTFGTHGEIDLRVGVVQFPNAGYSFTSPPAIYHDLAIVGPSTPEGPGKGPSGDPRAFDIRTGKLVWRFHTIPQPGEAGNDTWGLDGWKDRSGPSAWGIMTVDTERGLVFISTGNPADSFYGADRKGANLYANCVLALDAATGKLRWYHQLVHHDIFDYDAPGGPALINVVRDGRTTPAVAQITKMSLLFILDRLTGEPIFGEEERAVPKSDVPGEESWPTQPFPLKPPPLARTSITAADLSKRTPEAEKYCREQFEHMRTGPLYTPFGTNATLVFPGAMGGGNWGGVSFDPGAGFIFANTSNLGAIGHMTPSPAGSPVPYRNESGYARFLDQEHYPCQQPPWGELTAVNANTGDIAWRVPLDTPNVGGPISTAGGLVFLAATNDSLIRAFDSHTGKELWSERLDATGNATPITYQGKDGKQYVAVVAGGPAHLRNVGDQSANVADSVIAFAIGGKDQSAKTAPTTAATKPAGDELPKAPAKALVVRVCTKCHGVKTFAGTRLSREEWEYEVNTMIARGASATPREFKTIIDYLATNLGNGK